MKQTRFTKHIRLDKTDIPKGWMENLVTKGKIGGVMLVYVEGFSELEINTKTRMIKEFCKTLQDKVTVEGGE